MTGGVVALSIQSVTTPNGLEPQNTVCVQTWAALMSMKPWLGLLPATDLLLARSGYQLQPIAGRRMVAHITRPNVSPIDVPNATEPPTPLRTSNKQPAALQLSLR